LQLHARLLFKADDERGYHNPQKQQTAQDQPQYFPSWGIPWVQNNGLHELM